MFTKQIRDKQNVRTVMQWLSTQWDGEMWLNLRDSQEIECLWLHGQLGRKDGGGGSKPTFKFLYWGLINQERKYRKRTNLGGNDDLLNYGHVPGGTKSCVFGYSLWFKMPNVFIFVGSSQQSLKNISLRSTHEILSCQQSTYSQFRTHI